MKFKVWHRQVVRRRPEDGRAAAIALPLHRHLPSLQACTEQAAGLQGGRCHRHQVAAQGGGAAQEGTFAADQKTEQFAEDAGIGGRLRVFQDSIALKDLPALGGPRAPACSRQPPMPGGRQDEVAKQAAVPARKVSSIISGTTDRSPSLAPRSPCMSCRRSTVSSTRSWRLARRQGLSQKPSLNGTPALSWGARGVGRKHSAHRGHKLKSIRPSTSPVRVRGRASVRSGTRPEAPRAGPGHAGAARSIQAGLPKYFRRCSPETNASKLQKTAEQLDRHPEIREHRQRPADDFAEHHGPGERPRCRRCRREERCPRRHLDQGRQYLHRSADRAMTCILASCSIGRTTITTSTSIQIFTGHHHQRQLNYQNRIISQRYQQYPQLQQLSYKLEELPCDAA